MDLLYRKNYMILCSPSPGTQQSEKRTFRSRHSLDISSMILPLSFRQRLNRNWVPGEMEFAWKIYLFSMPIFCTKSLKKSISSTPDLNLLSLD